MCEVKEAWKMSGVDSLFAIVEEIKKGTKDIELSNKGYTTELVQKAHEMISLATSITK